MRFDRRELAGSLGDLGTLLPLGIGLIQINGLAPAPTLLAIGLFYVLAGLYFGVPVPVQPMKVIGAYAIARALTPVEITTAGMAMGVVLLLLAATGVVTAVGRIVPRAAVKGVQFTTGALLLAQGVEFMLGRGKVQALRGLAEPFLNVQSFGPVPAGVVLGAGAVALVLLLERSRRFPAGLVVVAAGVVAGLGLGGGENLSGFRLGVFLPEFLPHGLPRTAEIAVALTVLALPQIPMTIGNAVIAQADLTRRYFGPKRARRGTEKAFAASMGVANIAGALIGAMPLCHGAGGLAAHYRFGARTAGSNLMVGLAFLALALFVGDRAVAVLGLLPFSVLGALLVFAGAELALTILDVKERNDALVVMAIFGVSLVTNLAAGFAVGIVLRWVLPSVKSQV